MDSIKVAIKVRPLIKREKEDNLPIQWIIQDNSIAHFDPELKKRGDPLFFDHVFDTCKTNYDVFDVIAKPIVNAAINGMNGTIFAYGQTSSGKTYTMMGEKDCPGVIPLSVEYIFDQITSSYDREFLLRVSYIEIYNEKVHDLLDKDGIDLKIKEDKTGQAIVQCKEEVVNCPENVLAIMRKGLKNRRIGETNMNEKSSRSHTIFRVIIESREPNSDGAVQVSQLNLVDLAGSERPKQSGATGDRFNEGRHINLSLSALGLVIMQLSENQDNPQRFVNFRDSKLTRILQTSLGGNTKTTIICAVTPAAVEETQNTLAFASRAKRINNKPEVNEVLSDAALLKRYAKQLTKLKNELEKARGANLEEMESKLMEKESKLIEKDRAYQLLEERIELLKTRIVSGNSTPEDESFKVRSKRRRTWCGSGSSQTKLFPFQTIGLPTIKETEKSPEKDVKKEQRKKRQSIIQSIDIPSQKFETAFTDFELELIESERARLRLSNGSSGGDDEVAVITKRSQHAVQFRENVAIIEDERTSPEVTPVKKKTEPESPGTPKSVLRSRVDFFREQFVTLKDEHSSILDYTTLERQMFVDEAIEAAMVEHRKTVESLKQELAESEKSKQELHEKYKKLESHSSESDKRVEDLQKALVKSTSSLRTLKNENESLVHELNKLKSTQTTTLIQSSENLSNEKETSSIFANTTYFDDMDVSDSQCDSLLPNDTVTMESILMTDMNLTNNTTINKMDESKKLNNNINVTFSEFMKEISEKSSEELIRVTQDLFNTKLSLEEENTKLEATLRQKVREADDVKNDIRELKSGIEKLQETIQILTSENTDLTSKLSHEKEFAKEAEKSFQSTIAELNSSIERMSQEKTAVERTMKEFDKKLDSSLAIDPTTLNLIEEYKQTIKSLITENIELSSSVVSLTEDLDRLKAEISGEHTCHYRQSMIDLLERNKSLESENVEMSNNLMDKIEEYDILKKEYELLCSKLSAPSQQEISQNLLNISMTCTSGNVAIDSERSMIKTNGEKDVELVNCKFSGSQFPTTTVDDLLRLSLPPSNPMPEKVSRTDGETIDDLLQTSVFPAEVFNPTEISKEESIEQYKMAAQMLQKQVEKLTSMNEKLRELTTTSCKKCAHLVELRQNHKMLEKEVKTLNRTLNNLQTKFEREIADTEILLTKASEDINLSVCDSSFNSSINLEGSLNVSFFEDRVQSLRNEIETLKSKHEKLSNLYKEKCDEIEEIQDNSTRESSPAVVDSPRQRRDDTKLERIQIEIEKLQNDQRSFRKNIASMSATLQKFDHVKSMQNEIETLKNEKIMLEKKLMETKSFSLVSEKCESLENKITSLMSEISSYKTVKEQLEREKLLQSSDIESLKLEKENLEGKLIQESKSLAIAEEKIQTMENEVIRLNSEISNYKAAAEQVKNTKLSLEAEMQSLRAEKQVLQDKLMEIESSLVPQEKVDSLAKEVARMSTEMKNYETVKAQLEEAKLSLEMEIQALKAENDEGKLSVTEQIVKKDETIESLKNEVSRLISDHEDFAVVRCQWEESKLSLETEIQRLKTEKDEEKLMVTAEIVKKDETIKSLTNEVSQFVSALENFNVVKSQLEEAKLSLETEIETLKTKKDEEKLSSIQLIAKKDSTIADLENQVACLTSEIDNFNKVQGQLEEAKLSLETEIQTLKTKKDEEKLSTTQLIAEKDSTITDLENQVACLTSEIANFNEVQGQLEKAKLSLETEIQTLKTQKDEEILSTSQLIAEKDSMIADLENQVAHLTLENDNFNEVQVQLEEANLSLETEIHTLKTKKHEDELSTSQLIAEKDSTIADLENQIVRLTSEIDNYSVVQGQLKEAKLSLETEIQMLKNGKDEKVGKDPMIDKLETKVAALTSKIDIFNGIQGQLEEAKSTLETEIQTFKIETDDEKLLTSELIVNKNSGIEMLKSKVASFASEIEKVNFAKNELEEIKSSVEYVLEYLFSTKKEEENLSTKDSKIEEIKTQVAEPTSDIENTKMMKSVLEQAKSSLESEVNLSKLKNEGFEEMLLKKGNTSFSEEKVKSLESEISRLSSEIKDSEAARKELEEAKLLLENKVQSLEEENKELEKKILEAENISRNQEKIALERKVESLSIEKTEIQQSLMNLRETLSKLDEKNMELNEELRSMKASEELVSLVAMKSDKMNGLEPTESSIATKTEKTSLISPYDKNLEELESAKKSMRKEIMALKPSTDDLNLEEKSTSELFGFFVTTIMTKEQEVIKALSDNFEKEKRKLVENKRQSIDAEKRATVWAKELEAEIEKNQQDLIFQESKITELSQKISSLENLLLETNHENQMLKEKMKVLEADFDTMEIKLVKPSESRQNSIGNPSQDKERFIRESVDTREMELSSKLRQAEKQYKEKLDELTNSLEHLKTRNIDLSNNLEGLEANERQLKNIIDMKTNELAKCNITIERIQSELNVMTESYNQSSRDNVKKEEKILEITSLLKTKCDKLSEYKTKLETITPEYEKLKEQATERQLKLEKYKSEIECLTAENEKTISSLKDRLDSEEIKSTGYRKQLIELTNRNTTLQMELAQLRTKCEELEISNAKMAKSMRNSTSKIRAEEEMEELRDRNRTLERNLDGAGNRINELQDVKTRLTKELVDLRVQYESTFVQNEELKSVLSSHRSSVADTIEWREKYEAALQEKSRLEMELIDKRTRFEQMEKKITVLNRENEELKVKNVELDTEMDDIVCKIKELSKENGKLDDQLFNAQNMIESFKVKIKELETINLGFEKKAKDYVDEIESLKSQRNKLRCESVTTYKSLNSENSELRTRMSPLDRGDSFSCGDSERSSSPALEAARVDHRRRRSRNELFNINRPLELFENEKDESCQCDTYKEHCKELEQDLVLKKARIATLELKIQSEIFPHMKKCKDLEEIVCSLTKKNKTLKAEIRNLQETRAKEMSSECERCKQWKLNKRDQASQCMPNSTPIYMSGMSSGVIDAHIKIAKLEKERAALKNLCRSRAKKNIELEQSNKELKERITEFEKGPKNSNITDKSSTSDSSTFNTILISDSSNPSREAMKENIPAIWENPKQSSTTRRNWFN